MFWYSSYLIQYFCTQFSDRFYSPGCTLLWESGNSRIFFCQQLIEKIKESSWLDLLSELEKIRITKRLWHWSRAKFISDPIITIFYSLDLFSANDFPLPASCGKREGTSLSFDYLCFHIRSIDCWKWTSDLRIISSWLLNKTRTVKKMLAAFLMKDRANLGHGITLLNIVTKNIISKHCATLLNIANHCSIL